MVSGSPTFVLVSHCSKLINFEVWTFGQTDRKTGNSLGRHPDEGKITKNIQCIKIKHGDLEESWVEDNHSLWEITAGFLMFYRPNSYLLLYLSSLTFSCRV